MLQVYVEMVISQCFFFFFFQGHPVKRELFSQLPANVLRQHENKTFRKLQFAINLD